MKETAFESLMGNLANRENCTVSDIKAQADYARSQVDADIEEINELEKMSIEYLTDEP